MDCDILSIHSLPEWQDDKRCNSLFAPFRPKESNPVDWESKMKFWRTAIDKWCFDLNKAVVTVKTLQKAFRRKDRLPQSISTVVDELMRTGDLKKKNEFLATVPYQSWTGWAVSSLVKSPVSWSYSKLFGSIISPEEEEEQYVNVIFLKKKGLELLKKTAEMEEDLISCQDARNILSRDGCPLSSECLHLILHWLQLDKKARVEDVDGKKLIKLVHNKKNTNDVSPISEADLAIFKVQQDIAILSKNLEHLETEKEKCIEEAKAYLNKGLRQTAKSRLRKKKELEKCIDKRSAALDNLETLLSRLRSTESDAKVIEAYRIGLSALKSTFKSSGLSEDGVFDTISQLQEMNDLREEVEQAISQPLAGTLTVAEEDLEEELNDILAKSHNDSDVSELFGLPDVPTHEIPDSKKDPSYSVAMMTF